MIKKADVSSAIGLPQSESRNSGLCVAYVSNGGAMLWKHGNMKNKNKLVE